MKKSIAFILTMALSFCLIAAAVPALALPSTTPTPAASVTVDASDLYTVSVENGHVVIMVNEATPQQWAAAYSASPNYSGFSRLIDAPITVEGPKGAVKHVDLQGDLPSLSDEDFDAVINDENEIQDRASASNSVGFASVLRTETGYKAVPQPGTCYRCIKWMDADGNQIGDLYYMQIEVKVAQGVGTVDIGFDVLPDATPVPAARMTVDGRLGLTCDCDEGSAVYTIDDALFVYDSTNSSINTNVQAPQGGTFDYCTDSDGNYYSVNNGLINVGLPCFSVDGSLFTRTTQLMLNWVGRDGEGNPLSVSETLTVSSKITGDKGWMDIYWTPVPKERISWSNTDGSGLNIECSNGSVTESFESGRLPDVNSIRNMTLNIDAPSEAVKYKLITASAGNIGFNYNKTYADLMKSDFEQQSMTAGIEARKELYQMQSFTVDGITVWYGTDSLKVVLIAWYDNNGDLVAGEYCKMTAGSFLYETRTEAVSEITGNETVLTVEGDAGWSLVCERLPHSGSNAMYLRLKLQNGGHDVTSRPSGARIFIPYPEGLTAEQRTNMNCTVKHYFDNNHTSSETLQVEALENGWVFTTTSFSPFLVLWSERNHSVPGSNSEFVIGADESAVTVTPPSTGDGQTAIFAAALLVIAGATALGLRSFFTEKHR